MNYEQGSTFTARTVAVNTLQDVHYAYKALLLNADTLATTHNIAQCHLNCLTWSPTLVEVVNGIHSDQGPPQGLTQQR